MGGRPSAGIRQVYGGLILEMQVGTRKLSGEIYEAAPTIVAMGRQPAFDRLVSAKYWERYQIWPLYFGA